MTDETIGKDQVDQVREYLLEAHLARRTRPRIVLSDEREALLEALLARLGYGVAERLVVPDSREALRQAGRLPRPGQEIDDQD